MCGEKTIVLLLLQGFYKKYLGRYGGKELKKI